MVSKLLRDASARLKKSESPMLDARVLLAKAMGKSNAALITDMPNDNELAVFNEYIEKRALGIPVAYISGEKEFMGLTFRLNQDTLIPRPDTECLVEKIIESNNLSSPKILDLCTGSGCIGISLASFIPCSECDLTDISENAMDKAKENALLNGVKDRTNVFKIDVLKDDIPKGYDIIVSNPPYIKSDIVPTLDVSEFEPCRALDGGKDGLLFYRLIIQKSYEALNEGSVLALEIGYDQGEEVKELLKDFSKVSVYKDYGGNDRVIIAIK